MTTAATVVFILWATSQDVTPAVHTPIETFATLQECNVAVDGMTTFDKATEPDIKKQDRWDCLPSNVSPGQKYVLWTAKVLTVAERCLAILGCHTPFKSVSSYETLQECKTEEARQWRTFNDGQHLRRLIVCLPSTVNLRD